MTNKVILKWALALGDVNRVPHGRVLKVGFQNGGLHAWVEHDQQQGPDLFQMHLRVVPTGLPFVSDGLEYVDTAVSDRLVWHVYRQV